jgi:ketosteroid isomerase-like protein
MANDVENENIQAVRALGEHASAGRWDAVKPYISDEVVAILPAGLPFGGTYRGWQGYLDAIAKVGAFWADLRYAPSELTAVGNKVVAVTEIEGTVAKSGKVIKMPFVEVLEFNKGKVVRVTPFYHDTRALSDLAD